MAKYELEPIGTPSFSKPTHRESIILTSPITTRLVSEWCLGFKRARWRGSIAAESSSSISKEEGMDFIHSEKLSICHLPYYITQGQSLKMATVTKIQPWKQFSRGAAAAAAEQTPEEMNLQRSYGTHASNTKGRIFTIEDKPKSQPWKTNWPSKGEETAELSEAEMNMQRSYGTHASNTKGRIFTIETKPSS
ncbi:hypothetical protein AB5N19_02132 [Seiridium cardinale]|uniref:Uncharacterized protein n=1 Tax=Seiridium cardinale TaxID=138064 RepID=A0ABR2XMU6_9PEZI